MFPRKIYRITYLCDDDQGTCFYRLDRKGKLAPSNIRDIEEEISQKIGIDVMIVNIQEMN